jgi:hypothetical protein
VQALLEKFVPAADEVWGLQNGDTPAAKLFQVIAEQGHYAGRTKPTNTRQGIYATAPSGKLLASINSRDAGQVAAMLRKALDAWEAMPDEERWLAEDEAARVIDTPGWERLYPDDGLVTRIVARDLPREKEMGDWRDLAWNQDFAWFRAEEVRHLVPGEKTPGAMAAWPERVSKRLASAHFTDYVRGQVGPFDDDQVESATIESEVVEVEGNLVSIRLTGRTRAVAEGVWPVEGFRDMDDPKQRERGVELELRGHAVFDTLRERFVEFEMVGIGTRWGGAQYNGRAGDLEPGPLGYLVTLAEDDARIPPAAIWRYGWR